jgi:AcrR family transcriptional regulator
LEILKAALRLFARDGIDGTTIRAIADEAGYTNPALFKFFASKEALALHLFERCYLHLYAEVDAAIRPARPFQENLKATLAVYAAYFDANPEAFLFVQDRLREFWPKMPKQVRNASILAKLSSLLDQGVREGVIDGKADTNLLLAAITGFLQQFARMAYFGEFKGQAGSWAEEIEAVVYKMVSA